MSAPQNQPILLCYDGSAGAKRAIQTVAALFPDRARFLRLQADGLLDSADAAAAKVLAYLERADFGSQSVADVRG